MTVLNDGIGEEVGCEGENPGFIKNIALHRSAIFFIKVIGKMVIQPFLH